MKIDTSGIDPGRLAQRLNAEYELDLDTPSVAFFPHGEEAYSYVGTGRDGGRHFIRAQRTTGAPALESVFAVTHGLHARCGLRQVVAPYQTRRGAFTCRHGEYTVAVFPFIEGPTAFEAGLSDEGLARATALIAGVHSSGRCLAGLLHAQETFENPFEAPILRALGAAEAPDPSANVYQRRARQLLIAERADILATLATMRQLQAEAQRLDPEWVPTHGDPNLANILIDERGVLHLTDWGEVALGPRERDLFHFTGERFEAFLCRYLATVGRVELHERLFAFYTYRWTVQEIADYTTRILFRNTDPMEDRHAWEELAPYLPIRHTTMQADLRAIGEVIGRVAGD